MRIISCDGRVFPENTISHVGNPYLVSSPLSAFVNILAFSFATVCRCFNGTHACVLHMRNHISQYKEGCRKRTYLACKMTNYQWAFKYRSTMDQKHCGYKVICISGISTILSRELD